MKVETIRKFEELGVSVAVLELVAKNYDGIKLGDELFFFQEPSGWDDFILTVLDYETLPGEIEGGLGRRIVLSVRDVLLWQVLQDMIDDFGEVIEVDPDLLEFHRLIANGFSSEPVIDVDGNPTVVEYYKVLFDKWWDVAKRDLYELGHIELI